MSSSSTNKGYILQVTGENPNSWGTQLNNNMISVVDSNLGGNLSISVAGGVDVTPTSTQAQNLFHKLTGLLTGNINYILPTAGGFYLVNNTTTGAFTVTVKTSAGTGVVVPQSQQTLVYCDGANFLMFGTGFDRDHAGSWVTVGGTANAITLTYAPAVAGYLQGQKFAFKASAANTGATTVAVNGLAAKNVFKKSASGAVACVGGEIQNGDIVELEYDGTQFQITSDTPLLFTPSVITNSIGADVLLNNVGTYFDGPSVAQGTTGTWFASGTITVQDTAGAASILVKLWDGTTVIASTTNSTIAANNVFVVALSGFIASPAGNIRISAKDTSSTSGKILANASLNSKDSTVTAFRVA